MQLFEKENVRTRSKIRRGVAPKPISKGEKLAFIGKDQKNISKSWSEDAISIPYTQEMEELRGRLVLTWESLRPDVILPAQTPRSTHLSPEKEMVQELLMDTLEELRDTYLPTSALKLKAEKRGDILAWIHGDKAKLSFEHVMSLLDINLTPAKAAILFAARSWAETDGAVPDLLIDRDSHRYTFANEPPKPKPIFEGRCAYLAETPIPRQSSSRGKKRTKKANAISDNLSTR